MSRNQNRRNFSQNFLADRSVVDRILKAAEPSGLVLEPGGGSGVLTRALTDHARVWTWEIDPHFATILRENTRARVIRGDFSLARPPEREFQVVGNIPYSATNAIVRWCLAAKGMQSATLLTQLEYALKRTGGYRRWSRLTVLTWPVFAWEFHGRVPARAFRPVPRVDSGILRIVRREQPSLPHSQWAGFERMIDCAFRGEGGNVGASLGRAYGKRGATRALTEAGVAYSALVGTVHPDAWVVVWSRLAAHASSATGAANCAS